MGMRMVMQMLMVVVESWRRRRRRQAGKQTHADAAAGWRPVATIVRRVDRPRTATHRPHPRRPRPPVPKRHASQPHQQCHRSHGASAWEAKSTTVDDDSDDDGDDDHDDDDDDGAAAGARAAVAARAVVAAAQDMGDADTLTGVGVAYGSGGAAAVGSTIPGPQGWSVTHLPTRRPRCDGRSTFTQTPAPATHTPAAPQ